MLLLLWMFKEIHCSFVYYGKWLEAKDAYLKEIVTKYYTAKQWMSCCCHKRKEKKEREREIRKSGSLCTDIEWSQGRLSRKIRVEGKCGCHCLVNNRGKERRYTHICSHIYRISLDRKQEKLLTIVGTYKRMEVWVAGDRERRKG